MNIKFAFEFALERFKKNKLDNHELEARWLVAGVLKVPETAIWSDSKRKLSKEEIMNLSLKIEERLSGKPLAYILGEKEFYGRAFEVTSATLIPRPETEQIIDVVLKVVGKSDPIRICDMGTGTGCIGLTLLAELPKATLTTIDISPDAIEVAKRNAERLKVAGRAEIIFGAVAPGHFHEGQFDLVVANPPYIAEDDPEVDAHVRQFEPHTALFAPDLGYKLIFDWIMITASILRPGGFFVFEIGRNQAQETLKFIDKIKSFGDAQVMKDLAGHDRLIIGKRL